MGPRHALRDYHDKPGSAPTGGDHDLAIDLDTATLQPCERRAFLERALSELSDPPRLSMELLTPRNSLVHGRFLSTSFGALVLGVAEISGCVTRYRVGRDPPSRLGSLAAAPADSYMLFQVLRGTNVIVQDGHHAAFRAGDFGVLDNSCSWISTVDHAYRAVSCTFPRNRFGHSREHIAGITAKPIPGHQGVAAAIGSYLGQLVQEAELGQITGDSERIVQSTLDLIACLLHNQKISAETQLRSSRLELMERIHAYIAANLGDPTLSPQRVARAHYISRSYLDKLFRAEATTVSRFIRELRLERFRQQLSDPACVQESITSIAFRWGMSSPAHLSHVFRDTNGCSPSEYRARCIT